MSPRRPKIAIINSSAEVVGLLVEWFVADGMDAVGAEVRDFRGGRRSIEDFLAQERPDVILWDVALPYAPNWAYLKHILGRRDLRLPPLLVTTTNRAALYEMTGETVEVFEIVGRPFDLEALTAAVHRAIGWQPHPRTELVHGAR